MSSEQSHKGEKLRSFTLDFKKRVVEYAIENSNREAARCHEVDERRVREWRSKIEDITAKNLAKGGVKRKRLDGAGRKITNADLEAEVLEWVHEGRSRMLRVSRKLIMRKAKRIHDESIDDQAVRDSFVASCGWLEKFFEEKRTFSQEKNNNSSKGS